MACPGISPIAANRDVFIRAPEIYAPQYGGHCLTSLSRGFLTDGKPRLYVIEALKLYFFYSTGQPRGLPDVARLRRSQAADDNGRSCPKSLSDRR